MLGYQVPYISKPPRLFIGEQNQAYLSSCCTPTFCIIYLMLLRVYFITCLRQTVDDVSICRAQQHKNLYISPFEIWHLRKQDILCRQGAKNEPTKYSGGSNSEQVRYSDGSQSFSSSPNHLKTEHSKWPLQQRSFYHIQYNIFIYKTIQAKAAILKSLTWNGPDHSKSELFKMAALALVVVYINFYIVYSKTTNAKVAILSVQMFGF